jgi:hypothetical protein
MTDIEDKEKREQERINLPKFMKVSGQLIK